ncbi:hypothetical protein [Bradyrhizobium sp. SZCCHNR2012]|nr:hypothetical protein [Bradyrhizobium sp. SZCCHNR2012]
MIRAVRGVHDGLPSLSGAGDDYPQNHLRIVVVTIDKKKVDSLISFEKIAMPFGLIYIDLANGASEHCD